MIHRLRAHLLHSLAGLSILVLAACGAGASPGATTASAPGVAEESAATAPSAPQATVAGANDAAQTINAIATTSIIGDLVANVGGERVNVRAILPPGTDPHTFTLAPADVQAVAESQILFENGLGLEAWLEELIANAGGSRLVVTVSEGLTPIEGLADEDGRGDDPHMWFDVQRAIGYVENIRAGLKEVDPAGAGAYDANAAAYIEQLRQLDAEIEQQLATIPDDRRKLITNHDTFGYFAQRYGFEVVGSVFEGVSTEEEPSAQQVAQLVDLIRSENVPAIFTENTVNPRLAEQIATEADISVVTSLYTDALGEPGSDGDTYIDMMRYNVAQIVAALR